MTDDKLVSEINWELDELHFHQQIKDYIARSHALGKVLVLPIRVGETDPKHFLEKMALLQSMLHCQGCGAVCCRSNPDGEPFELLPTDGKRLEAYDAAHGNHLIRKQDGMRELPMPCPYLAYDHCAVYPIRPFICMLYPFQPGGENSNGEPLVAVESRCPEARRIAELVYMNYYHIAHQTREQIKSLEGG